MKKSVKFLGILLLICLIISCAAEPKQKLLESDISFRFADISFAGDWEDYAANGVSQYRLTLDSDTNAALASTNDFDLQEAITYDTGNAPSLPNLNKEAYYLFTPKTSDKTVPLRFDTAFKTTDGKVYKNLQHKDAADLKKGTANDISLVYSNTSTPALDLEVDFTRTESGTIPMYYAEGKLFDFESEWEWIHRSSRGVDTSINLVVLAEGYRADQMEYYRAYVRDAFANPANFHYPKYRDSANDHITNDFFARYWDYTNVFMVESVSPQEGIDHKALDNKILSILDLCDDLLSAYFFGNAARIMAVMQETFKSEELTIKDVDAYIILVNDTVFDRPYSYSHGPNIGYNGESGEIIGRRGEPVHSVMIPAPAGRNVTDKDFHDNVQTDAIAHELGHAIAQLQDEYADTEKTSFFLPIFLNVSGNKDFVWKRLIEVDPDYLSNYTNEPLVYNIDSKIDNRLGVFQGAMYSPTDYYRSTYNSTMRGIDDHGADNFQFGPVNTYYMEASFKYRMGEVVHDEYFVNWPLSYERDNYTFEQFSYEWPPECFMRNSN
jgi:hypothetical protein